MLSEKACQKAVEKFGLDRMVEKSIKVFESATDNQHKSSTL
jgi:hypothetical protein